MLLIAVGPVATKLTPAYGDVWTPDMVLARMSEAMAVSLMIAGGGVGPSPRVTYWTDVVHDAMEAYGYTPEDGAEGGSRAPMQQASPGQIKRADEVQRWISRWLTRKACTDAGLVEDTGRVLTCRAMGWSYPRIGRFRQQEWIDRRVLRRQADGSVRIPGGNNRYSLTALERKGLRYMAEQLNRASVPIDPLSGP